MFGQISISQCQTHTSENWNKHRILNFEAPCFRSSENGPNCALDNTQKGLMGKRVS